MKRALAFAAATMWALALLVGVLGWTGSLSALSLTAPAGESLELALIKSAIVLISWFCAVMIAPVLLLTSMTWTLLARSAR